MSRFFAALHKVVWDHPRAVVLSLAFVSAVAAGLAARLTFSSDISNILPTSSPAVRAVAEVVEHFNFTGQMFVFMEKNDPNATDAAAMKLVEGVARRLEASPLVSRVDWRITPESETFMAKLVSDNGPLLLPEEDVPAFMERLTGPEIRKAVKRNRRRLEGAAVGSADMLVAVDPIDLTRDFFLKSLAAGRPSGSTDISTGFYFNAARTTVFLTIDGTSPPQDVAFARQLVDQVDAAVAAARAETPEAAGWEATLMGGYPVALHSESTIKSDMAINILTSIPPVLLILVISLRRWFGLAIGAVSLAVGTLWTFGLAGLLYGRLTAVTVAFAALLAGIGIDLTIHMFHRYRDERDRGLSPFDASLRTYYGTGPGAFIAMVTTVFSFFCLWISEFKGLREFATLVGVGLALVFAATFFIIPLFTRREQVRGAKAVPEWIIRICWALFVVYLVTSVSLFTTFGLVVAASCVLLMSEWGKRLLLAFVVGRAKLAAAAGVVITAASLVVMFTQEPLGLPAQETDVKNLRTENDTLIEAQERMRSAYGSGIDPILVLDRGANEDEAMDRAAAVAKALKGFPESSSQSIVSFIPPASQQRRVMEKLKAVDVERVISDLDAALDAEGFEVKEFEGARERLRAQLTRTEPVRPSGIADPWFASLRHRFVGVDERGTVRTLTWFLPRSALHIRSDRERVITELDRTARAASPTAMLSGFSVVVKEIDDRIGPDIFWSTLAGGIVSCVLAWVLYGSFRWMVASIFPAIVGSFWLIAILKVMDVRMNYLSLIAFPIMAGIATDNGLYLVERFREIGCRSALEATESVWKSLTLVSLTTVIGFGSLAFSANRAMKSLGVALSVSMLVYLFASIILLPPFLKWLERKQNQS